MQLLTEVQFDHLERITVAEPFTCIQCEMLLSKSGRGKSKAGKLFTCDSPCGKI